MSGFVVATVPVLPVCPHCSRVNTLKLSSPLHLNESTIISCWLMQPDLVLVEMRDADFSGTSCSVKCRRIKIQTTCCTESEELSHPYVRHSKRPSLSFLSLHGLEKAEVLQLESVGRLSAMITAQLPKLTAQRSSQGVLPKSVCIG